jgi:hypothetical protein
VKGSIGQPLTVIGGGGGPGYQAGQGIASHQIGIVILMSAFVVNELEGSIGIVEGVLTIAIPVPAEPIQQ